MANKVLRSSEVEELKFSRMAGNEELKHYGVLGMKWGVRRNTNKVRKLNKRTSKAIRKFDRGHNNKDDISKLAVEVRKRKFKVDKGVQRAKRYLDKASKADTMGIINRYNRDPEKRKVAEAYLEGMKENSAVLSELRSQLMDARI